MEAEKPGEGKDLERSKKIWGKREKDLGKRELDLEKERNLKKR